MRAGTHFCSLQRPGGVGGSGQEETGLLNDQGDKKYKLVFHNASFKEKVLKYGTPKPRKFEVRNKNMHPEPS